MKFHVHGRLQQANPKHSCFKGLIETEAGGMHLKGNLCSDSAHCSLLCILGILPSRWISSGSLHIILGRCNWP
ncbi:Uncharacterised protein [Chlamydia trachomatis]|nr:Uncharacterised protein [Chlamydia trachomatis]